MKLNLCIKSGRVVCMNFWGPSLRSVPGHGYGKESKPTAWEGRAEWHMYFIDERVLERVRRAESAQKGGDQQTSLLWPPLIGRSLRRRNNGENKKKKKSLLQCHNNETVIPGYFCIAFGSSNMQWRSLLIIRNLRINTFLQQLLNSLYVIQAHSNTQLSLLWKNIGSLTSPITFLGDFFIFLKNYFNHVQCQENI